jgi:hypothetical protein
METLGFLTVDLGKNIAAVGLEIFYPQVGTLMPDMELAIIALCIKHISAIGTNPGNTDTPALGSSIDL